MFVVTVLKMYMPKVSQASWYRKKKKIPKAQKSMMTYAESRYFLSAQPNPVINATNMNIPNLLN